jgi:hypothetical protein
MGATAACAELSKPCRAKVRGRLESQTRLHEPYGSWYIRKITWYQNLYEANARALLHDTRLAPLKQPLCKHWVRLQRARLETCGMQVHALVC